MSDPDHPSSDIDRNTPRGLAIDVVLFAVGLMMLLPLVFLISNAFKTPSELLVWPPTIIPNQPTLENILGVLHETPLLRWIGNTLIFAAFSMASIVATSAIAGYVLGKFDLPWFPAVFGIIIATSVVPFEVYMIPLYLNVQAAGMLNTLPGLLVGYLVMSFGIFLVRQYVTTSIPDELLDAARVNWAGEGWIFLRIVLPLMRGPLGALAVLAFFQAWTAFAWPLVVTTNKDTYTPEVGLALSRPASPWISVISARPPRSPSRSKRAVLLADAPKLCARRGWDRSEGTIAKTPAARRSEASAQRLSHRPCGL